MAAPGSYADRVKGRADMLAIAGKYTRLRRAGRQYVGLCPLHSEKYPSFYVHPERKIFYCFGCGAGGDLFRFVMLAERCTFVEAVGFVAAAGRRRRPAVFAGRVSQGAKPPQAAKQPTFHSPKELRRFVALDDDFPSRDCAAERGAILLVNEQITGHE
jgi:DNA primase